MLFLLSLSAFGFFGLDEDEDFDWAGVCEEDAAGRELLLSEEDCLACRFGPGQCSKGCACRG